MSKNICSFLLAFVMITSYVISPFIQPSTVDATTNQEQANDVEYVNKKLGFSLIIPESWKDKYVIEEGEDFVRFIFKYGSKKYDEIPPLFSISYAPNDGREEGLRWIGKLGTKNDMAYYYSYDAISFYQQDIPPGEEQDTVLTMRNQISDVFDTFKVLGEEGSAAGEAKPKEQGEYGSQTEGANNQETANGIKYINEELGFELTLPKIWKDHYIVEENDHGGVTFKFKFDGKVYDDIYLFDLFVENREYSNEEKEMMGDVELLEVKNGKTYLMTPNIGIYFYKDYDDIFASVPKEGRKIIEAMSKQKLILNFKVLGEKGATAEEAKPNGEELEGSPAEEAKSPNLPASIDYTGTNHNKSILIDYVNKKSLYTLIANHRFMDISSASAKGSVAQSYAEKANNLLNILLERFNKTTVDREKVMHAFRNYPDPAKATEDFMDNWETKGMAPGTIFISPQSEAKGYRIGHAAIVSPDGKHIIEAPGPDKQLQKIPLNKFLNDYQYWVVYIVDGATKEQALAASKYAEKQYNSKKSYIETGELILEGAFSTSKYREDAFYCSSLVWRSWKNQGFDIDYNDDSSTPVEGVVEILDDYSWLSPIPKPHSTVFPAEIVKDPLPIPITVSDTLKGQDLETKAANFPNKFIAFNKDTFEDNPSYSTNIWQSKGHFFKLNVKNTSRSKVSITITKSEDSAKLYYYYILKPGKELVDIYIRTPEGNHTLEIRFLDQNIAYKVGEVNGTLQSVIMNN